MIRLMGVMAIALIFTLAVVVTLLSTYMASKPHDHLAKALVCDAIDKYFIVMLAEDKKFGPRASWHIENYLLANQS